MNMIELSNFHFLRPEFLWLLSLLPLIFLLANKKANNGAWQQVIAPHLLKFMLQSGVDNKKRPKSGLMTLLSLLAILALSGPSFRQQPVPVFTTEQARVILLDLSLSMDARDIQPSRLARAKFKVQDLLKQTREGSVALVVYAGDAFVISPLTNDANTIAAMVPVLSTGIMPVLGSHPEKGIALALQLLKNAGQTDGQIIWLTDGVDAEQASLIKAQMSNSESTLSILAVGTKQGAPIPLPQDNGFLKDSAGSIVVPKLDLATLSHLANDLDATLVSLTADDQDISRLLQSYDIDDSQSARDKKGNERAINRWLDDGYFLVWLILLLALWPLLKNGHFRLNSYASIFCMLGFLMMTGSQQVHASVWDDLWKTKDQQGQFYFQNKDYDKAAELFENSQWRAAAEYKKKDYQKAIEQMANPKTADDHYNLANALARSGQLEQSIAQYNKALELNPNDQDIQFNKKLVEDLLKKQQEQQKNQQQNQDQNQKKNDQKNDQQSDDQQQNNQSNKDSENQDNKQKQKKKQQKEQQSEQEQAKEEQQQQVKASEDKRSEQEKDQALKHWLEKIPDDPGGLLRRKMYREYQKRGGRQNEKKVW